MNRENTNEKGVKILMTEEMQPHILTRGQKFYMGVKAAMDFVIALIMIIVLSPLFLITAIAIKIDSKGPVFFLQKRYGKDGKTFTCIKFRSMSVNARHEVASRDLTEASSCITRVGKVIRRLSIDELPQLFCLLNFRMSLIGYRPSICGEKELHMERQAYRVYQLRPGLSGWAQVNGRDVLAADYHKKARYDAYYLQHFSLWLDIKIFFMTIVKVFKSEGVVEGSDSNKELDGVQSVVEEKNQ